jgi:DNA-binding NarL/FixJ family response regulator
MEQANDRPPPNTCTATVCDVVCAGKRDRDIAAEMGLDHRTIATYKRDILKKYGLSGPQELMLWAIRESLVQDYRHVPSGAADATHV